MGTKYTRQLITFASDKSKRIFHTANKKNPQLDKILDKFNALYHCVNGLLLLKLLLPLAMQLSVYNKPPRFSVVSQVLIPSNLNVLSSTKII
jgi:hypothetical protein